MTTKPINTQLDLFGRCKDNHQRSIHQDNQGRYICDTCGADVQHATYWR